MEKRGYIYIIANEKDGVIYVGVTSDLVKRIYEHKNKLIKGFSAKYNIDKLVYFEIYDEITEAIRREKRLKKYKKEQKIKLIEKENPDWNDLYKMLF